MVVPLPLPCVVIGLDSSGAELIAVVAIERALEVRLSLNGIELIALEPERADRCGRGWFWSGDGCRHRRGLWSNLLDHLLLELPIGRSRGELGARPETGRNDHRLLGFLGRFGFLGGWFRRRSWGWRWCRELGLVPESGLEFRSRRLAEGLGVGVGPGKQTSPPKGSGVQLCAKESAG